MTDDLFAFAADIRQEVLLRADLEDKESLRPEAFTEILLESLEEAGELDGGHVCYHRDRGIEVSGYGVNEEADVLNLFTTIYRGDVPPTTVGNPDIEVSFRRLLTFWNRTAEAYHKTLEDSSEAFDMAMRLHEVHGSVAQLRLFLLTDGLARSEHRPAEEIGGVETSFHIWDIRRLHRLVTSGQRREPIEIDFVSRFGAAIPCLPAASGGEYEAFLAIIPGNVLNEIYAQYGPRLLELNVRSYLQARGKVNQGIRRTILDEPGRFLAYNNGISCTASEVVLVDLPGGGRGIHRIKNLQIVNGGQTTASIHHAVRRDHADASVIQVPAKLTVVAEDRLEKIVPLISRYANSQNKISEADFSANDPFHVRVEELSRTTWAPATDGTMRQTRWFYERARGQYADALGRAWLCRAAAAIQAGAPARTEVHKDGPGQVREHVGSTAANREPRCPEEFRRVHASAGGTPPGRTRRRLSPASDREGDLVPARRAPRLSAELRRLPRQHRHVQPRLPLPRDGSSH